MSAQLRLALAQINPTVGDLLGNADLIVRYIGKAHAGGAHVLVFPEMIVTGYPVEDLALRPTFRAASRKSYYRGSATGCGPRAWRSRSHRWLSG